MDSLWFRTKPRSVLKAIEWFPYFAELENQDWNYLLKDTVSSWKNKSIYPIRRKYIFSAHGYELDVDTYEDYVTGLYDTNETESTGRNDKTSFEFLGFGYVNDKGIIRTTKVGRLIKEGKMSDELLLRQLLKIQFPSPSIHKPPDGKNVFLMEILIKLFNHFDYLNKFEIGFIFGCSDTGNIVNTLNAIKEFRERYKKLPNKQKIKQVEQLFDEIFTKYYPIIKNKTETYYKEYSDSFIRALQYTGIFAQRGRGLYVKLYVPEHSKTKIKLLQEKYTFIFNVEQDFDKYMEWFGDPYSIVLPWETEDNRRLIVDEKIIILKKKIEEAKSKIANFKNDIEIKKANSLIEFEMNITNQILSLNEELFIKYNSKTKEVRDEIVEKFIDILQGNEDMAALWLEVNTWKSLVAINGEQNVKRNFKVEEDLTPKSFAPGTGNTPDMELYKNGYIIIPEVSLMTGVKQWEHEGSSVIQHVFKFIEQNLDKEIYGLFISSQMNIRTIWQFFILNRESWIGRAVPVIPLTIKQYINIIIFIYDKNLNIDDFKQLIENIHKKTFRYLTFKEWDQGIESFIEEWKNLCIKAV